MKKIKDYYNSAKLQSVMCLIVIWIMFLLITDTPKLSLIIGTIFFIVLYVIVIILTNRFKDKKYTTSISLLISLFILMLFFFNIFFWGLDGAIKETENPTDDITKYNIHNKYLLRVFPKKISKGVTNAHYMYAPGFLQAPTRYILYYTDKKIDIKKFDKKYSKKAIWIGYKNEIENDDNLKEGIHTKLNDYDLSETPIEKSDDFKIYLRDYDCDYSGWCNHGVYLYCAINEKTKEVVYKASQW